MCLSVAALIESSHSRAQSVPSPLPLHQVQGPALCTPFLPPASTTMLHSVMRSSMVMASTTGPTNSMERYVAPATPMSPMICGEVGFGGIQGVGAPCNCGAPAHAEASQRSRQCNRRLQQRCA